MPLIPSRMLRRNRFTNYNYDEDCCVDYVTMVPLCRSSSISCRPRWKPSSSPTRFCFLHRKLYQRLTFTICNRPRSFWKNVRNSWRSGICAARPNCCSPRSQCKSKRYTNNGKKKWAQFVSMTDIVLRVIKLLNYSPASDNHRDQPRIINKTYSIASYNHLWRCDIFLWNINVNITAVFILKSTCYADPFPI
jgi:hypothetical protein